MKVKKVLVSAFLLAICLMNVQAQRRNEIQVPDLDGYTANGDGTLSSQTYYRRAYHL